MSTSKPGQILARRIIKRPGAVVGQARCLSVGGLGDSEVIEYYERNWTGKMPVPLMIRVYLE